MNSKNKSKSLMFKTMLMLTVFTVVIFLTIYFVQTVLVNWYYERYKIRSVNEIAEKIAKNGVDQSLKDEIIESDLCVAIYDTDSDDNPFDIEYYNEHSKGCILNIPNQKIHTIMDDMIKNKEKDSYYKLVNPEFHSRSIIYGTILGDDEYILINAQLESLDYTTIIIKQQLVYILIVIIIFTIIISLFISNSITKPIRSIIEKSKKLGNGDLNVEFERSNILEIDELSKTLNYAKSEMKKTDDYRRDLMANVGHDLKTPLTLIKSYAEMVRDISYKDETKRNKHLNVIVNETDRLNELVNDIISLSQIESAEEEDLKIVEYDLVKQINNIIAKFEILELTENYHFETDMPEEAMVHADEKKINQVIYNLIGNAINYTGDDQKVFIKVKSHKDTYKVEIIDTGKGIDSKTIKLVWNRYYKTEKKHRRNKVGTGLGLSIVKEVLEKHNFKYGVDSTVGKGTNFYFYIKK